MRHNLVPLVFWCFAASAHAHDARCDSPPFTVPADKYSNLISALTNVFGSPKLELISQICKAKYDGADQTTLYQLGFTDQQIDDTSTDQLVIDFLRALRKVLRPSN